MLKRYLQKWLGVGRTTERDIELIYEELAKSNRRISSLESDNFLQSCAISDLKLTKQNKPQNRKPPVRKKVGKRA